jgi:hypothetical protein
MKQDTSQVVERKKSIVMHSQQRAQLIKQDSYSHMSPQNCPDLGKSIRPCTLTSQPQERVVILGKEPPKRVISVSGLN